MTKTTHLIVGTRVTTGEDIILFTTPFGARWGIATAERLNAEAGNKYIHIRALEIVPSQP